MAEDDTTITIEIKGYNERKFTENIARHLNEEWELDFYGMVKKAISERLDAILGENAQDLMRGIAQEALALGLIVSEPYEEDVKRKPVSEIVLEAANDWMSNKHAGRRGESPFEELSRQIVHDELKKEISTILKGVKEEAIAEARKQIASVVGDALFNPATAALPRK